MVMKSSQSILPNLGSWPEVDTGCVVPYEVFTDTHYFDREQTSIFRGNTWNFVGLEAELPNSGDYKTTFIGETPVLITIACR